MHLIQIFLPLYDNEGNRFSATAYDRVRTELVEQFGGLTAYIRSPARGVWVEEETGKTVPDDIVIYEVMAAEMDRDWWQQYKTQLTQRFRQEEMVVRVFKIETL